MHEKSQAMEGKTMRERPSMNDRHFGFDQKVMIGIVILCVVGAIISFTLLAAHFSSDDFLNPITTSLDEKKQDVLELTAASTGTSIGITVLPGDIATPIAEKMANVSTYLLVVMCAIYLEKYLVTVMGFVTFRILIPIGLALLAVGTAIGNRVWHRIAFRLILFGLALFCVIPISVHISDFIFVKRGTGRRSIHRRAGRERRQEHLGAHYGFP